MTYINIILLITFDKLLLKYYKEKYIFPFNNNSYKLKVKEEA